MKYSETWLREWVNPALSLQDLAHQLTMAGLEVEEVSPIAPPLTGVVVGEVLQTVTHPHAAQLNLCTVSIDATSAPLQIVCGAPNVQAGMKVAVATLGAKLADQEPIQQTTIRQIDSCGMLCSAAELGLSEDNAGILALPADAPLGQALWSYLQLDDHIIDIGLTPNRGDCLSIRGLAREVAALTGAAYTSLAITPVSPTIAATCDVHVIAPEACPNYIGRVIQGVRTDFVSPVWLSERLRRCGVRSINPVVDVVNYVMLCLGQPMHAFDLATLKTPVTVRESSDGEVIELLDGSKKELEQGTLVIADKAGPIAIAGVMGGLASAVSTSTSSIFLESAYFTPATVARARQRYGLNSDSAYRYERGIDPTMQRDAIELATQLIIACAGGEAGPLIECLSVTHLPTPASVVLRYKKLKQVLGFDIAAEAIEDIFKRLQLSYRSDNKGSLDVQWTLTIPSYRTDLRIEEDIIEEVARLYGYDHVPTHRGNVGLIAQATLDQSAHLQTLADHLCHLGYHEIISYSFIDKALQSLLDPMQETCELLNPMTAEMAVMRTSLWPGLVMAMHYNKSRQQQRIRLFEMGTCFRYHAKELCQPKRLAGLVMGSCLPEQWGTRTEAVNFFDVKGDVEQLLSAYFPLAEISFKPTDHPALHPGQAAAIYHQEQCLGIMGRLHPSVLQTLDVQEEIFVFELALAHLQPKALATYSDVSKFPEIRRDLSILVNQAVPVKEIQDTIKGIAGGWLKDVFIFDVYQGKGISPDVKSIALALILQHPTRTLVDDEVAELIERVIMTLKGQLGAELRS